MKCFCRFFSCNSSDAMSGLRVDLDNANLLEDIESLRVGLFETRRKQLHASQLNNVFEP